MLKAISGGPLSARPGSLRFRALWFAAAIVESSKGVGAAFAALFFGGMLIFPLATVASRLLFRRAKEASDNPLRAIALESTIAMIGGLFVAWLFLRFQPHYVFPVAAIAVGTHYAVFKTVYGDALFWLLGGLITAIGLLSIFEVVPIPGGPILAVGVVELLFAVLLTMRETHGARSAG
jgi:hypothetical protein